MLDTCLGEYRHQLRRSSQGFVPFRGLECVQVVPGAGGTRSIEMPPPPLQSQIIVGKISAHDWPGPSRLLLLQ
jgi:hypothetical protein